MARCGQQYNQAPELLRDIHTTLPGARAGGSDLGFVLRWSSRRCVGTRRRVVHPRLWSRAIRRADNGRDTPGISMLARKPPLSQAGKYR
jgi:hypothetical protein